MDLLSHPGGQSVLLPGVIALGILSLGWLRPLEALTAGVVTAGALACLVSALGIAPWPPRTALHRMTWLLLLASLLAPLVQLWEPARQRRGRVIAAFVLPGFAVLAWPRLADPQALFLVALVAGAGGSLFIVARLERQAAPAADGGAMLLVAALTLCAGALIASSLVLAQALLALAVASAVVLVRVMWCGSSPAAAAAIAWGGAGLCLLGALLPLLTSAPGWPLALLPLVFFADRVLARRAPARWRVVIVAATAAVPGMLVLAGMLALQHFADTGDDAYYGG